MKKSVLFFSVTILLLIFMSMMSFVSAALSDSITGGLDSVTNTFEPVLKYILGSTPDGEFLLVKLLFLILLLGVIYQAVRHVPTIGENKSLSWLIAIIASILAVRYLTSEAIVTFIWLPTGVLGVALASILPFIIYFFFIQGFDQGMIRKVGWITFGVIYLGLAIVRWPDLAIDQGYNLGWLYILIFVLSILAFLFDDRIKKMVTANRIMQKISEESLSDILTIKRQIKEKRSLLSEASGDEADKLKREIKRLEDRIKDLA
ncbi:hypothetical protein J4205_00100 [Candidatus Pacearchaeota archaeon]|nr:hypothetical protein [Candidatus Pacearchaeota archaeon]